MKMHTFVLLLPMACPALTRSGKTVQCSKFSVQSSVFKVQCSKFGVQSSVFKVRCSKFSVQGTDQITVTGGQVATPARSAQNKFASSQPDSCVASIIHEIRLTRPEIAADHRNLPGL